MSLCEPLPPFSSSQLDRLDDTPVVPKPSALTPARLVLLEEATHRERLFLMFPNQKKKKASLQSQSPDAANLNGLIPEASETG